MPLHPRTCSGLYSVSCLLDALDGYAARYFEQSTRFGAVLDMVTDRCTTACLLVFLSSAWPRWAILFQGLISLDLASHYVHMYATLSMGGSDQSHKQVDKTRSWLLNLYYTNKVCPADRSVSCTDDPLDRPVHMLCPQRALLHCLVPPVLLLALPVSVAPADRDPGWVGQHPPAWDARRATSRIALPEPVQRRCAGIGEGQQDGLDRAVDHCWCVLPGHGLQAGPQHPSTSLCKPVVG